MDPSRDDAFSNLKLTQKQTVFLIGASMVLLGVSFIAGVQVGRGVRGTLPPALYSEATVPDAPLPNDLPPPPPVQTGNSQSPEGIVKETVTYPDRLTQPGPANESLTDTPAVRNEVLPAESIVDASAVAPDEVSTGAAPAAGASTSDATTDRGPAGPTAGSSASEATAFPEPPGSGLAVQVSAFRNRREADAMAGRLASKGYAAYVVAPAPGAPNLFRVRIGKFANRADADRVVTRLSREERLEPWIVR